MNSRAGARNRSGYPDILDRRTYEKTGRLGEGPVDPHHNRGSSPPIMARVPGGAGAEHHLPEHRRSSPLRTGGILGQGESAHVRRGERP
jgi:hypothetical protein